MLELYHYWSSVCSVKVRICLAEKGLDWQSHHVDLFTFEQLTPAYLVLNPKGVVPTLLDDRRPVVESSLINEYLEDAYPATPLAPEDPYARARMRAWIKDSDEIVFPAIALTSNVDYVGKKLAQRHAGDMAALEANIRRKPSPQVVARHLRAVRGQIGAAEVDAALTGFRGVLARMEQALETGGPWIMGAYSLADIAMAPNFYRMERLGRRGLWDDAHPAV
ncbi:MAG: glutathione S-transferase family protein, partial [Rhodospirillales bacterium]|nr:glutathione S-transferase family protein [Rhodospirillales bacterium]